MIGEEQVGTAVVASEVDVIRGPRWKRDWRRGPSRHSRPFGLEDGPKVDRGKRRIDLALRRDLIEALVGPIVVRGPGRLIIVRHSRQQLVVGNPLILLPPSLKLVALAHVAAINHTVFEAKETGRPAKGYGPTHDPTLSAVHGVVVLAPLAHTWT